MSEIAPPPLSLPGRRRPFGAGWRWAAEGWRIFRRAWLMWLIAAVIVFLASLLMSLVPVIGTLAFQVLGAAIYAGFMVGCRALEQGGELELEHLFGGFTSRHFGKLVLVGVAFVLAGVAIMLVFAAFVGISILPALLAGDAELIAAAAAASALAILLGALVALALLVPVLAAYWFAPALIVFHGLGPMAALRESFFACLRNILPFLLFGVVLLLAALVAAALLVIPILGWIAGFLGLVATFVVSVTGTYVAYREVFSEPEAPPGVEVSV